MARYGLTPVAALACSACDRVAAEAPSQVPSEPKSEQVQDSPQAGAPAEGRGVLPWRTLEGPLHAAIPDAEAWIDEEDWQQDDQTLESWLCSAPGGCSGEGPWALKLESSSAWAHVFVRYSDSAGWTVGDVFGVGGSGSCGEAGTHVETLDESPLRVRVTSSMQICEIPTDDPWICGSDEGGSGCGELYTTSCELGFDGTTLQVTSTTGECDAYEAGTAKGLHF